ncbi:hypothetical protein ScPMuIL_005176 [Solemya velum]
MSSAVPDLTPVPCPPRSLTSPQCHIPRGPWLHPSVMSSGVPDLTPVPCPSSSLTSPQYRVLRGVRLASGSGDRADALKHALDTVDIYTWGTGLEARPGTGFDVPGGEILDALQSGVTQGRGGKGAVYMSAAGDGGVADNCNTDGYASSIYTITITSLAYTQEPASYAEVCSPALAAAYGGGDGHDLISTTKDGCSNTSLEGTTLATSLAAGIIALALEANNNLTWRDVQHLIVQTSKMNGTGGTEGRYDWVLNGAGLYVSHRLGFGLLDASALVTAAKTWENVPEQKQCNTDNLEVLEQLNFTHMSQTTMEIIGCSVKYLEHVKIGITFDVTWAGALELKLTSPKKTESYLLTERPNDETRDQTRLVLEFMSAHFWGENTEGNWNLTAKIVDANSTGYIHSWHLQLYGTEAIPNPYPRDDCGRPKLVAHADILGDDTSYGSTLTYQCHTGYTPTGGDTIVCLAYGVWSRRTYSCPKVDCMSPAPMMNAQLRQTTTTYGSTAIYTCDTGYVLHNDTVTCLETGEWSALDDTCTIANCGTPSAVLHADFEVTNTTYLSNATYSCVIGYNTSVSSVVVCQDTEKWTAPTLTCTIVDCGEPHGGANMTLQFSNTTYSSTVSAACHAGYVPSGSDTSVCQEDGTWSVLSLTCTYVECGIPQEQDYMQVEVGNVTFDSVATYRCSNRFMTSGNGTVTCQSNGHWSKLALRCDGGTACRNRPSLLIWIGVLLACFLSGALFV